jgi:hypothetical protein
MKKLSFYEQVGIVVPGSVLLFGLLLLQPDLRALFAKDGVTVGGLGIFVLIAYAAGHLVAALGNLLEAVLWAPFGGMPSNWVVRVDSRLLTPQQVMLLEKLVRARLRLEIPTLVGMPRSAWNRMFQQLYRDVLIHGEGRVETFNGNYGLNRGLAASTLMLATLVPVFVSGKYYVSVILLCVAAVYLYRSYRFGVHFAREVFTRFLLLPAEPPNATKTAPEQKDPKTEQQPPD